MTSWEEKLLDKARQVVESGWGRIEMCITNEGRRKTYAQTFTDVDDLTKGREESRLQIAK